MNRRARLEVQDLIARVLAVCGGGRVAVAGSRAVLIASELRRLAVDASVVSPDALPERGTVAILWLDGTLDGLDDPAREAWAQRLRTIGPRVLIVQAAHGHEALTRLFLRHDWRRHPQYQSVINYASLEHPEPGAPLVFEPLPDTARLARDPAALTATRDLHMDMLREAGRRADAHVARYEWARTFVRPGDRILDAACGLGYGSALLTDATLAESVLGLDADGDAIAYAREHYGTGRPRLSFDTRDLAVLDDLPAASFDVIVSFETLEHLDDPDRFVAACERLLTPGGRFLCSVPNEWVDETGTDPNPHHLHVFDRARLEALCSRAFAVEHVYGQTAGGGMKLPDRPRAIWDAGDRTDAAEWWLLAGMSDPLASCQDPVRTRWTTSPHRTRTNLLAFDRDYEHPWLIRSMIAMGQRTSSPVLLGSLAERVRALAPPGSADRGAALCVQAYRALEQEADADLLLAAIDEYCAGHAATPHARRWHISLRYVQGLLHLTAGARASAARAFEQCAMADPLAFNPLLATKTVAAASMLGWMQVQEGRLDGARRWWRHGLDAAERALGRPWSELVVDRDAPVLFGLREAADILDLASQCATGLHLLPHAAERPGILAAQRAETQARRLAASQRSAERWSMAAGERRLVGQDPPGAIRVDHARRAVVFGTGQAGTWALEMASACRLEVVYLVDNNRDVWGCERWGYTVRPPATLAQRDFDIVIVASVAGRDAIAAQLESMGLVYGTDFVHVRDRVVASCLQVQVVG